MNISSTDTTEDLWLRYKAFIRYKYLVDDVPLKELVRVLHDQGFTITKAKLEYKIKKWGFSKNFKASTWRAIARVIKKRKQMGKESEVRRNEQIIDKAKVAKEIARHRQTLVDELKPDPKRRSLSPDISVCTPSTANHGIAWPETLPWLEIRDAFWDPCVSKPNNLVANARLTLPSNETASMILMYMFRRRSDTGYITFADLTTALFMTMPDRDSGDRAQAINTPTAEPSSAILPKLFGVMLYNLSNGLPHTSESDLNALSSILPIAMAGNEADIKSLRAKHITIRAFFEQLFKAEIHRVTRPQPLQRQGYEMRPLNLIKLLLDVGQDPNQPVLGHRGFRNVTPIQAALQCGHVVLVRLLLDFHASIDECQKYLEGPSAIQSILSNGLSKVEQSRLLRVLHDYRAISVEQIFCGAIELNDSLLIEQLLQEDIDVTKTHHEWPIEDGSSCSFKLEICLCRKSPLTASLGMGNDLFARLLGHPSTTSHPAYVVSPEFFVIAATKGDFDTMAYLLELEPLGLTCQFNDITPLTAAVAYNNLPIARLLLDLGAVTSSHLLVIAASFGLQDMLQLLIHYGVPLNKVGRRGRQSLRWFDDLGDVYFQGAQPIIKMLLDSFKRAVTVSQISCLTTLIQAGAPLMGGEISAFAERGWLGPLNAALSSGWDPNDRDRSGRTVIQVSLHSTNKNTISHDGEPLTLVDRYHTIKVLLEHGAGLVGGETVQSIRDNDKDLTTLLHHHGGSLTDTDQDGTSYLEAFIMTGHFDGYEATYDYPERHFLWSLIRDRGVSINVGSLCAAIQTQNWRLVDDLLLLPFQESPDRRALESTAIGLTARAGNLQVLRKILGRTSKPLNLQPAFVPFTLYLGNVFGRELLGEVERDSFWRSRSASHVPITCSPLVLAALGAEAVGFEELLRQGFRPDLITIAVVMRYKTASGCFQILRQYCSDFRILARPREPLRSLLNISIMDGDIDQLKQLVEAGLDVNDHDVTIFYGRSPLQQAVELGDLEAVEYLLEQGAHVNAPPAYYMGATALQLASINGYIGLAKILLDHGARVNAIGARHEGRTALEGAAEYGRLDMLEFLLQNSANYIGSGRIQFVSAVRYASDEGYTACAEWLKHNYGWSEEDQVIIDGGDLGYTMLTHHCKKCFPFCCHEIHGSEEECIYDYPRDLEHHLDKVCNDCVSDSEWSGEEDEQSRRCASAREWSEDEDE
ncbi:sex-determining fem-1 [Fusarium longipes]|uniref:Sex-determining fem-1 n=1 Tax=Fusarium longipes TaxID=694270 RepID=A0A395SMQ4_9HYPO|nr:sex-determining fem-1 [Fusarium longipes]